MEPSSPKGDTGAGGINKGESATTFPPILVDSTQMLPPPLPPPPSSSARQQQQIEQQHQQQRQSSDVSDTLSSHLPQGQCRYIFTMPELKGQRCGCASFTHDKARPGATCDCGHLSCYHLSSPNATSPGMRKDQIDLLKQRIDLLEKHCGVGVEVTDLSQVVPRLSQLEEAVDRNREDLQTEIKGSYRNISTAWQLIEQLQRKMADFEEFHRIQSERLARAGKELDDLRNRDLELLETDEMLEERIEKLEGLEPTHSPGLDPVMSDGALPELPPGLGSMAAQRPRRPSASRPVPQSPAETLQVPAQTQRPTAQSSQQNSLSSTLGLWTVHVSIVPSRVQPFPFKKDTNAYKRCLSRGLHKMVAIQGTSNEAFTNAISRSFRGVFQGASWEPLQTRICDARTLEGLPALRTLDPEDAKNGYDYEFLEKHCGVCDTEGRIHSLYLAIRDDTLSWLKIKQLPIFVEGLETSWEFDGDLDDFQDEKDAMDKHRPVHTPSGFPLKRTASEMQSSALATGGLIPNEDEGPMAKKSRNLPGMIQIR